MVDLETFGTDSNSVIVSISAVVFDRATGEIIDTFEKGLNIKQQLDNGGVMDADTIMWWLSQSKEAQSELTKLGQTDISLALGEFAGFCSKNGVYKIWGNGATFDNVILRNLYKRCGFEFPTPFWSDRDVRTLVDIGDVDTSQYKFEGVKHRGIDDCKHQIKYCIDAMRKLGV
jgi:exodeoxyribonuclease VIII